MYRHGLIPHPSCCIPSLSRYYVVSDGALRHLCINMPLSLMRAGSWRLRRSGDPRNCCIRKSAAGPAASGSAAGPTVTGLLPLPLLGSEFSRVLAEYLPASVELALLDPLLLPPPKLVGRCYLTATQGVTWLTCIIRVLLPSQLDTAGPGGAAGVSSPGSAVSGTCCRSYRPSPCPNHHWEVRVIFLYLANLLLLPLPLMGIETPSLCTFPTMSAPV